VLPALPCLAAWAIAGARRAGAVQVIVAVALVVPIIPLVARVALQPIADASVLVLLIASLASALPAVGLGLLFFGPEGRAPRRSRGGAISLGGFSVRRQVAAHGRRVARPERPVLPRLRGAPSPARRCARPRSTASARAWSASGRRAPRCSPTCARRCSPG
jgi:hypothetical protein